MPLSTSRSRRASSLASSRSSTVASSTPRNTTSTSIIPSSSSTASISTAITSISNDGIPRGHLYRMRSTTHLRPPEIAQALAQLQSQQQQVQQTQLNMDLIASILQRTQTEELTKEERKEIKKFLKTRTSDELVAILARDKKIRKKTGRSIPRKILTIGNSGSPPVLATDLWELSVITMNHVAQLVDYYEALLLAENITDKNDPLTCMTFKEVIIRDIEEMHVMTKEMMKKFTFLKNDVPSNVPEESTIYKCITKNRTILESPPPAGRGMSFSKSLLNDPPTQFLIQRNILKFLISDGISRLGVNITCLLSFMNAADVNSASHFFVMSATVRTFFDVLKNLADDIETLCEIQEHMPSLSPTPSDYTSVWDDTELPSDDLIRPGSLNNMIVRLTSTSPSITTNSTQNNTQAYITSIPSTIQSIDALTTVFLNVYPGLCTSEQLLQKLKQRFDVPPTVDPETTLQIRQKTSSVLLQWVKQDIHTFSDKFLYSLRNFTKFLEVCDCETIAKRVNEEINTVRVQTNLPFPAPTPTVTTVPTTITTTGTTTTRTTITTTITTTVPMVYDLRGVALHAMPLCCEPQDIAEQLTLIDLQIFKNIDTRELIGQKWSKAATKIFSQNVVQFIGRVNQIGFWVATSILMQERLADRTKMLKQMISVAAHLLELNNFHSLMGMLAGFSIASVSRLTHTIGNLSRKNVEKLQAIQVIQEPTGGFKNLREAIKNATGPLVPYLGLTLHDLTRIEEGNPSEVHPEGFSSGPLLINFPKHFLIHKAIKDLLSHQSVTCFTGNMSSVSNNSTGNNTSENMLKIVPLDPLRIFLQELPFLSEKELHALSLEREPRGCSLKDLY